MISKWNYQPLTHQQKQETEALLGRCGGMPAITELLVRRGVRTQEEADAFFAPSISDLHDPFLMPDMDKAVNRLAFLFGLPVKVGNSGSFAGTIVEVLNSKGRGTHGHLAIRTNYIERAINYMTTVLGAEFHEPILRPDGKINAIYGRSGLEGLGQQVMGDLQKVTSLSDALLANIRFGHALINSPLLLLFCVVLMAYAVITVFFSSLKRGGILLIQIAVGALYMFSVPRGYIDGFVQWVEQVIGLCLTAFLQAVLLAAGLLAFTSNALLGLGLMLSAMEVPRIAGAFGLDTSAKASLSSAVHTAQSAVSATRMIVQVVK